jgi:competence protein ComFC
MKVLAGFLQEWISAGLAFFYPEVCQICKKNRAKPVEGFVCGGCREQVQFIEPPFCKRCGIPVQGAITGAFECANCRQAELHFEAARSAVVAKGVVLEVIHRYKYQRALWFEVFLADLLVQQAAPQLAPKDWDLLVPVPLHPTKQRQREFNQSERLGRRLSRATGIPLDSKVVRRVVPTRTQTRLDREQRQENMRNAFAMRGKRRVTGQRILLLDDVFTTGATTNACAQALRKGGAVQVCVWTVARGV